MSTEPMSTDAMSTDAMSTDAMSTDAMSTDAMSTDPTPARERGDRRELLIAVLACLAGAGLALFAATRTWVVEVVARPAPLPAQRTPRTGDSLLPWLSALGIVALVASGALLATRDAGRRVVGVLLGVAGLGVAVGGVYGLVTVPAVTAGWPLLCAVGGLAAGAAGIFAVIRGGRWQSMGARYERTRRPAGTAPATATDTAKAGSETELWNALDRGEDPTAER